MSNYFGQLPPQFNNKHINNRFVKEYQNNANRETSFSNNAMLSDNPMFHNQVRDPSFFNRVNMAKMEQLKKTNNIKDLNLSTDQLTNFIICPIKVEKLNKSELDGNYATRQNTYMNVKNTKTFNNDIIPNTFNDKNIPQTMMDWYKSRSNAPYKNILKKEDYKKKFVNREDLIVHKVTQLDKNVLRLAEQLQAKEASMETHDKELKMIYSISEENKHKEQFNYNNYYKNRIKYDPKNYNDLKKHYEKKQKEIKRDNKRVDEMLELYLVSDDISKEEIEEIQKSLNVEDDDQTNSINEMIEENRRESELDLEKQLEKQLRNELGDDKFNEISELLNDDNECDDLMKTSKKQKIKESKKTKKPKESREESKESKKTKKPKESKEDTKESKKTKKPKEPKEDTKESKKTKKPKEPKEDTKESKKIKKPKEELKESKKTKEIKEEPKEEPKKSKKPKEELKESKKTKEIKEEPKKSKKPKEEPSESKKVKESKGETKRVKVKSEPIIDKPKVGNISKDDLDKYRNRKTKN
jgi:hypothetical protein